MTINPAAQAIFAAFFVMGLGQNDVVHTIIESVMVLGPNGATIVKRFGDQRVFLYPETHFLPFVPQTPLLGKPSFGGRPISTPDTQTSGGPKRGTSENGISLRVLIRNVNYHLAPPFC